MHSLSKSYQQPIIQTFEKFIKKKQCYFVKCQGFLHFPMEFSTNVFINVLQLEGGSLLWDFLLRKTRIERLSRDRNNKKKREGG